MFELKTPTTVRLTNLVCRVEAAGKRKDVPAVTMRLKLEGVENTMLDLISKTARSTFFAPIEGQEHLPGVEPTTPILRSKDIKHWTPEEIAFNGWKVLIDHGIDEADPIALDKCKIDGFAVDLYDGGRCDMEFKVSTSDIDSEGVGILWSSQKQLLPVTILAPELPAGGGTPATGAAIDGTTAAFQADHPDAGDLFAAGAGTPDPDDEGGDVPPEGDDDGSSAPDVERAEARAAQARATEGWPFGTKGAEGETPEPESGTPDASSETKPKGSRRGRKSAAVVE